MSPRPAAVPYNPQPSICPAIPLQICTLIFNNFQDAPPATHSFSIFCIVARGWYPPSVQQPFLAANRCFALFAPCLPLCFQQDPTVNFCNSFVLITIRIAGVGYALRGGDLKYHLKSSPFPLSHGWVVGVPLNGNIRASFPK